MSDISIVEKLECGNVTISELAKLSSRSRSSIYEDIAAGRLKTLKFGTAKNSPVFIPGPIARAYIAGELHREGSGAS